MDTSISNLVSKFKNRYPNIRISNGRIMISNVENFETHIHTQAIRYSLLLVNYRVQRTLNTEVKFEAK